MDEKYCFFCGSHRDLDNLYLNLDPHDNSINNVILSCVECKNLFYKKIGINAIKVCKDIGLIVDEKGNWLYDKETVRQELVSAQSLLKENENLRKDVILLQGKLSNLISYYGYEPEIRLTVNEQLLLWSLKKNFHCFKCGKLINLYKRDGKFVGNCSCGEHYITEIDRLKILKL